MTTSTSEESEERSTMAPTITFNILRTCLNLEMKAEDFVRVVKEEHYTSLVAHIVDMKARMEPESHDLCIEALDKIGSESLKKETLRATCQSYKKIVFHSGCLLSIDCKEQTRLRNLGRWLRKLLTRWSIEPEVVVEPEPLIIHAYKKGLLAAVIPFVFEILQHPNCQLDAHKPWANTNPWTMRILHLLAEIYRMPNLKVCPKYEIKLVFKTLKVDLNTISSSNLLEDEACDLDESPDFFRK